MNIQKLCKNQDKLDCLLLRTITLLFHFQIFYDKKCGAFVCLKQVENGGNIFSEPTGYLANCTFSFERYKIKQSYVDANLVPINICNLEEFAYPHDHGIVFSKFLGVSYHTKANISPMYHKYVFERSIGQIERLPDEDMKEDDFDADELGL